MILVHESVHALCSKLGALLQKQATNNSANIMQTGDKRVSEVTQARLKLWFCGYKRSVEPPSQVRTKSGNRITW
jgi:hypothetical protein